MTHPDSPEPILARLRELAERSPDSVSRMSMGQIARKLGMTRMTLYRRAGSHEAITASLSEAGIRLRSKPSVRERVIETTADLLRERAIGELTVEVIADRASCSRHAIYDQFGGRDGVLRAVFERYSPLLAMEKLTSAETSEGEPDLRRDAAALYGAIYDVVEPEWSVLLAFVAEAARDPQSEIGRLFHDWYAPLALDLVLPILIRHAERGSLRPVPLVLVLQAFVGPILLHLAAHGALVQRLGGNAPDRDATIDHFAEMFCRAVGADGPQEVPEADR